MQDRYDNHILPFLWMCGEEEAVIREEIAKIDKCGIKAVCLESRPHPDFAGPLWWRDLDIVLDEAKKRDMKVWIPDDVRYPAGKANDLLSAKYREHAKQYLSVKTFDVAGPLAHGALNLADPLSVTAFPLLDGDTIGADSRAVFPLPCGGCESGKPGEELQEEKRFHAFLKDGELIVDIPEGVWRICVVYTTCDEGSRNDHINVIDEDSVKALIDTVYEAHYRRYPEEFGKTIAGFFSDEPGFSNTDGFLYDEAVGRRMMPLPWNKEMPGMLEERLGVNYKELLAYIWYPCEEGGKAAAVRYAYMDAVTRLYQKNFSEQIGKWCADHQVGYIGHVIEDNGEHSRLGCGAGHYFRAMSGQTMAGIDNIGGQVVPGSPNSMRHGSVKADGPFFHYTLAKMGASAALFQTEKKGRLICETFGAYGWSLGVRDMKWVADHLISRGVNYFVPHAFLMDEYPDTYCPSHFYEEGKDPEFRYFGDLMRYCNRLCHVFSGGKWQPEVGIFYDGTLDWMSECMRDEAIGRVMYDNMIDYAIVPADALLAVSGEGPNTEHYKAEVKKGRLVLNDVSLKALIVPASEYADPVLLDFVKNHPEVNVLFAEKAPECFEDAKCVSRKDLVPALKDMGVVGARTNFTGPVSFYHYRKETGDLWMVFNESRSHTVHGDLLVRLKDEFMKVYRYDAMRNRIYPVEQIMASGFDTPVKICAVTLEPYESAVLFAADMEKTSAWVEDEGVRLTPEIVERAKLRTDSYAEIRECVPDWPVTNLRHRVHGVSTRMLTISDLSGGWEVSAKKAGTQEEEWMEVTEEILRDGQLIPVSDLLPRFSGFMKYRREINVDDPEGYYFLETQHLYEAGRVLVNGKEISSAMCPPYRFELTGAFSKGTNLLEVEVVNPPLWDAVSHEPGSPACEKGFYEPAGMFGLVRLIHCADERNA